MSKQIRMDCGECNATGWIGIGTPEYAFCPTCKGDGHVWLNRYKIRHLGTVEGKRGRAYSVYDRVTKEEHPFKGIRSAMRFIKAQLAAIKEGP